MQIYLAWKERRHTHHSFTNSKIKVPSSSSFGSRHNSRSSFGSSSLGSDNGKLNLVEDDKIDCNDEIFYEHEDTKEENEKSNILTKTIKRRPSFHQLQSEDLRRPRKAIQF